VRGRSARFIAALLVGIAVAALPLAAQAADLRQGSTVTVGGGQSINDDLYVAAGTIAVDGNVNGSVIVAGGTVTIAGTVTRDVMMAGGTLTVSGHVNGSVRAAGGTVTITGPVAQDIVIAGGTVDIGSGATTGRDLVLAGGNATVSGPVTRNILMGSGTLTVQGRVGGNISGRVNQLTLDGANVQGNLDYTSENEVRLINGGHVGGTTTRHPVGRNTGNGFLGWLRGLIGILALGLLFLFLLPRLSTRSIDTLRAEPWASLGIGAAVLIATPIVAVIVFVIGLLIGGWWIGLLMIPLWLLVLALGFVVAGFLLGRVIFARIGWGAYHDALALAAGLLILAIVGVVPILGWLIGLIALVVGTGALAIALARAAGRARTLPAV